MVFPAEQTLFFQVSIKLAQPFPAPELRTKILRTRGFFWYLPEKFYPNYFWNYHFLECRKWGFKRWGSKQIWGYLRKKAFFLRFLDFPGALRTLWKGRKRQKKGEKGRFWPISRKGGQTPLKPPFVTPPFAAAQVSRLELFRINFKKLPDTLCICVSCMTLPA